MANTNILLLLFPLIGNGTAEEWLTAEECDATGDDKSVAACNKKIPLLSKRDNHLKRTPLKEIEPVIFNRCGFL